LITAGRSGELGLRPATAGAAANHGGGGTIEMNGAQE
jgi:hypothetical protein